MATNNSVKDVSLAVLYTALQSAIDPLFDSVLKEYAIIYGLSDQEFSEYSRTPYHLSDKLSFCLDVCDDYELRYVLHRGSNDES